MNILPKEILVTNEPARVQCGAPDYVLTSGAANIPVGYIEAKDIGVDLNHKSLKEQFDRYKSGLSNLIFTDYLNFKFYRDGEFITEVRIAKTENDTIIPIESNFEQFESLILNFANTVTQSIKSPSKLAQLMAGKARLMANIIEQSLDFDDEMGTNSNLKNQITSFKTMLIHDINNRSFADIYSQTIAYGMFAARYHDPTLPTFSRIEAAELIPKSNPFLRKLFHDIAGFDVDTRIVWIVDELVTIFLATDVAKIMKTFGRSTKMEDPIIHFYETFLAEYDKSLRKARGVWYTPQPVVNFIVRAVDDILKEEFGLPQGLADKSKIKVKIKVQSADKRHKGGVTDFEKEVHRVQVLDPATGTGTFLAETIKHIYSKFKGMEGMWPKYVKEDLIPRMNGFELLMASYAMAHLKLDMLLTETGYTAEDNQRFRIYLTNSLEEAHPDTNTLFSSWLSDESSQANEVKRDTPVMVVIGNPPYAVSSQNRIVDEDGAPTWIGKLITDYKKELNEKSYNSLSDDYVKFIRYGQYHIEKKGSGILAFISNNSFIDGIVFRQMRKSLLRCFNSSYILDLHGNSKKKEKAPDGSIDQNVFDIMQGVSINIFVKTGNMKRNELGKVFHSEIFGRREFKYSFLNENGLKTINWQQLQFNDDNFFFVPKDFEEEKEYEKGFSLNILFPINNTGVKFRKDNLLVKSHFAKNNVVEMINDINSLSTNDLQNKYNFKETPDWKINEKKLLFKKYEFSDIQIVDYRPFDYRYTYYPEDKISKIIVRGDSRRNLMRHMLKDNLAIIVTRANRALSTSYFFLSNKICDLHLLDSAGDSLIVCPLYLYPETNGQTSIEEPSERVPNLNRETVDKIAKDLRLQFTNEKENTENTFAPIDILDYIYAILHSSAYREKYKEFLKINFPRVPYPTGQIIFWKLVELGQQIRELHLLESPHLNKLITSYPISGTNQVTKPYFEENYEIIDGDKISLIDPIYEIGRVYINETQFFQEVPKVAWDFYIGGYQPAQKWLKDRKERELDFDDVLHYQKIIAALMATDRLMKEVDKALEV
ncbi:type ISP restriction/modification enzyme [Sphingobacterium corticis]|uniref:site-specific DNA-methyltransferase (adenine-specific) n=1 Tax=Sphingobacterium corticis TaxID=1812823 RepID=A0ABW5NL15_9SPHI